MLKTYGLYNITSGKATSLLQQAKSSVEVFSEPGQKKSNLELNFAGALPKQQFNKRVSASLLSANLISLLHYMVLKKKKKQTSKFIKIVMNGSLRL